MLELTKKPLTDGLVHLELTVPVERLGRVEEAIAEALEPNSSIEEVFPDMGPGDVLAGARGLREMTQAQLGEKLGVHKANISAMERGKRTIGLDMAKRLGEALDMPFKMFL
ncbi:MAG: hypothetical protein PWQ57_1502 [Desulfovibrionales bacterium]|jgi:DNA-binding XRE family transcriptional regulator|nr:hypothetical protein [Desulfovibrionales bacterium]